MNIIAEQCVFCQMCGRPFLTSFEKYEGRVCSPVCHRGFERRRALVMKGKDEFQDLRELITSLREDLADLEHRQWTHWTKHMLTVLARQALIVNRLPDVQRWMGRCETPYQNLSEKEKDSDREWADKVLDVFGWYDQPEDE